MCMTQIRSMCIELVDQLALPCKFVYFEKLEYITVYPTLCAAPMFLLTLYIFISAELYISYLHVLFSNGSYTTGGRRITCGIEVRECLQGSEIGISILGKRLIKLTMWELSRVVEQGQGETPFPFLLAPLLNLPHSFFFWIIWCLVQLHLLRTRTLDLELKQNILLNEWMAWLA